MIQANPTPKISQKQSLALSKFLFSGRPVTTHNCRSAMILPLPKPDSREMLHPTHNSHSSFSCN
jgi:hypothetical protein